MERPHLIEGGQHSDERGVLSFFNTLDLSRAKRMYQLSHPDTSVVRAWQGHKKEAKWFYVTQGEFLINIAKPSDWDKAEAGVEYLESFVLKVGSNEVLYVPAGHANGFRALKKDSTALVFSDKSLEEAKDDHWRFAPHNWYDWEKTFNQNDN